MEGSYLASFPKCTSPKNPKLNGLEKAEENTTLKVFKDTFLSGQKFSKQNFQKTRHLW